MAHRHHRISEEGPVCGRAVREAHGRAGERGVKRQKGKRWGSAARTSDGMEINRVYCREDQERTGSVECAGGAAGNTAGPAPVGCSYPPLATGLPGPTTCPMYIIFPWNSHAHSFIYIQGCFHITRAGEWLQQTPHGLQTLKYLLPDPLQKKFADSGIEQ